ncbi:bifunctional aminoglycoside phosphotransferase/ATP-binding protein [Rhodoferax sp.]|uniref:bifunctional aminoglycoside phosphotransferase/ATP-binding protein n=1 Tax=Rhodoferax sp. TaxID=50421 RepID=UPI0026260358|nr:bifunctional aminoglycoside phosphotransferase/ATP-binding protein [Rhodoferax sp.]MDD2925578.1 AAA family ATPase [Rhodoferax sp.]
MSPNLPPLIEALLAPQRYPGGVPRVELVQTHISWVLLAGEFAYKIKKPLKLPFLDYSTLALRLACCQEELRLNQRYAPDIYLDVIGIGNTAQDPRLDGAGPTIEYAVRMRRFDRAGQLDRLCVRGELLPAHLSDLAGTLAAFHETAAIAPVASRFGTPAQVMAPARDNFRDLWPWLPAAALQARLLALQRWTEVQFSQLQPLMLVRQQSGRVRECHGDLHLANLVLLNGRVRLFDCIEFNDDLRWIDVACEMAFPYVDLLAHRQPGLAGWFLNEVLSHSGDYQAAWLLRFYAVYLALVRAKVAAIRSGQTHADQGEAIAHLALAEQLTAPPPQRLVITHGLSGCGKTVACSQWLQADPQAATLCLRADVERKRLFGLPGAAHSASAVNAGIYTADAHNQTYGQLLALANSLLRAGWSVLVDATFLKRADRDQFRDLARQTGAAFAILAPSATPEQLRERILARAAFGHDASEATLAVLAQQMREIEPLQADEGPVLTTPE